MHFIAALFPPLYSGCSLPTGGLPRTCFAYQCSTSYVLCLPVRYLARAWPTGALPRTGFVYGLSTPRAPCPRCPAPFSVSWPCTSGKQRWNSLAPKATCISFKLDGESNCLLLLMLYVGKLWEAHSTEQRESLRISVLLHRDQATDEDGPVLRVIPVSDGSGDEAYLRDVLAEYSN